LCMEANDEGDSLRGNQNSILVLVITGLIDAGFVLVWIVTQLLVSRFVFRTPLVVSSLDSWIVLVFQVVFAISTLVPVALYVIRDATISIGRLAGIREEFGQR
jgi:hypothetical protein